MAPTLWMENDSATYVYLQVGDNDTCSSSEQEVRHSPSVSHQVESDIHDACFVIRGHH